MKKKYLFFSVLFLCAFIIKANAGVLINTRDSAALFSPLKKTNITIRNQFPSVRPQSSSALQVNFELEKDWHFYASPTNPPSGLNLKVNTVSDKDFIKFSAPVFPPSETYQDKFSGLTVEVYSGKFAAYVPFTVGKFDLSGGQANLAKISVSIEGAMCSSDKCIPSKFEPMTIDLKIAADANMNEPLFTVPAAQKPLVQENSDILGILAALILAFLAGVILNIMPCVLPVIPLKVLSIFEQAKQERQRAIVLGLFFCIGILAFFVILAGINISLHLKGGSFQWGGHFQNPINIIIMSQILIALALFMFGVFTITVPGAIANREGRAKGLASSAAMGFFAAVLSTPCSFGILTASLVWAQTQNVFLSTIAIILIGIGMAVPYMILTSMPALLKFIPKPGRWTEIFKQAAGFVLLVVAMWLMTALPAERFIRTLYFGLILSFCLWMWGGWVTFTTPRAKKITIRIIALIIAIFAGILLLPASGKSEIDWLQYDSEKIQEAVAKGTPVLIDFTADWCLNCKAVEIYVYGDKKVSSLIKQKGVLSFWGDATRADFPAAKDLINIYKDPAFPVTVLHLPGQPEPIKLEGIFIKGKLLEYLQKLPDAVNQPAESSKKAGN